MLTRFLRATNRGRNIQAGLDKSSFERLPFSYSWDNLVKAYDLRQWYILNSQNEEQRFKYTLELEQLHNELNYLTLRSKGLRGLKSAWFLVFLLFFSYDEEICNFHARVLRILSLRL